MSRAICSTTAALALCLVCGCETPTQIDVSVTTNEACTNVSGTALTSGTLGEIESIPATATTQSCASGAIGDVVLIPSGSNDALVGFKVVMAINGENVESCTPDGGSYGPNCIVARRALRYIPHVSLQVDVLMSNKCAGVGCDATSTCVEGACVPATLPDPAECEGDGCNETVLGAADGGKLVVADGSAVDATLPDAGSDATTDATTDTSAPDDSGGSDAPAEAAPPSDGAVPGCDMRGLLAGAVWPMEEYCPTGRGRSPLLGPSTVPSFQWAVALPLGFASDPSIGPDGTLYSATGAGLIEAIHPDGGVAWLVSPFGDAGVLFSMPVLSSDGTLHVFDVSSSGFYGRVSLDGNNLGSSIVTNHPGRGAVAVGPDGTMYLGDVDSDLVALSPAGFVTLNLHGYATDFANPSLSSTGEIFSVSGGGDAYGVFDGGPIWTSSTDGGALSPPRIAPDGTLRTYSFDDTLYKLDPTTGHVDWQIPVIPGGAEDLVGMVIGDDGTTYVSSSQGLFAYDSDGHDAGTNGNYNIGPLVMDSAGNLYAMVDEGNLASFDHACNLRWETPQPIPNSAIYTFMPDTPILAPGGVIYVAINNNEDAGTINAYAP